MAKNKKRDARPGNLAFAQAMHGKHNLTHADKRTKRNRTRGTQKTRAIRDAS